MVSDGTELHDGGNRERPRLLPPVLAPEPEPNRSPAALHEELDRTGTWVRNRRTVRWRLKIQITFDPKARLITNAADSVVAEHYRRLRTKILQQQATKPFRSLLVVSPSPQEGKTVTVLNLGAEFRHAPVVQGSGGGWGPAKGQHRKSCSEWKTIPG